MNTNFLMRLKQALKEEKAQQAYMQQIQKQAAFRKWAAQPPMDPAMMGGAPPMDPAMMGGGMPMDPSMMGGGMPMDPSMMGGAPPMDPAMMGMPPVAPPPEAAPADPSADVSTGAAPKKMKPDEYMAKLDNRLYNAMIMLTAIVKHLNIPIPAEALIMPAAGKEPDMDNPLPDLPNIGGGNDTLALGGAAPGPAEEPAPPAGGETPKTASFKRRFQDADQDAKLRCIRDSLYRLGY